MKMLRYIILLAISTLLSVGPLMAQQPKAQGRTSEPARSRVAEWLDLTDTIPVFQGVNVMADLVGPGGYALGSDFMAVEAALEVNLLNRFFPVLEVGYGRTDATNEDTEFHYKTAAPYFRAGLNYNVQYKKKLPGYIYAGARIAYSSFKYDVDGPPMKDPVWGGDLPFRVTDVKGNALWAELLVGLRARIFKNLHMGWSFRYKVNLRVKDGPNSEPWYIPGYGANSSTKFGATYDVVYCIPWK